jgi:hypothetical protein
MPISAGGATVQALPIDPETGFLIRIELPPGVGPGILRIVRRNEIGDQGSGCTGHQGKTIRWTFLPVR